MQDSRRRVFIVNPAFLHGGRWRRRIQQTAAPGTHLGQCLFHLLFIFGAEFHLLLMATGLRCNSFFFPNRKNTVIIILKKRNKMTHNMTSTTQIIKSNK